LLGGLCIAFGNAASCGRWASPSEEKALAGAAGDGGGSGAHAGEPGEGEAGQGDGLAGAGGEGGASAGGEGGTLAGAGAGAAGGTLDGSGGTGGTSALGGSSAGGAPPLAPCTFSVEATTSPVIGTVGIVTFSVNLAALENAVVDFGLDDAYGMTAPVDLDEPEHRTLLVGMKPSRDYHFRVRASGGGETCVSEDRVLTTEPLQNGLPAPTVETSQRDLLTGGFIITSFLSKGPAFILDADGEYVWWFGAGDIGRAQLSADGKYLWYTAINVRGGTPSFRRVSLDGLDDRAFPEFGDAHHDFTVLPDDSVGFIQHDGACDRIMERAADGSVRQVIGVHEAHGGVTTCHTNSIHFHPEDQTYTFSDLNQDAYVKVTRAGEVVWVLGGTTSDFTGDGAQWNRQHGHHLTEQNRLLFFNNNQIPTPARVLEVSLDFTAMTATRTWDYGAGLATPIYGDVRRLTSGNILVTYGIAGVIEEVLPNQELVRAVRFGLGGALGYATHRRSLYAAAAE
jgi:hypothetical protein